MLSIELRTNPPALYESFDATSQRCGRYGVDVSVPTGMADGQRLPVILILDGTSYFDLLHAIAHGRQTIGLRRFGFSSAPSAILVGVGQPNDEAVIASMAKRHYDFHEDWDMEDLVGRQFRQSVEAMRVAYGEPPVAVRSGGYRNFMTFLGEELLPALAARYPVDLEGRHTLIGHSSAGLFTLRALYDERSPFKNYIAISPGGGPEGWLDEAEARYAAANEDLDARVFMCAGAAELQGMYGAMVRFGSIVTRTAERFTMRQWKSAELAWEIMNNEDHSSIVPRAIAAGLRSVFGTRPGVGSVVGSREAPTPNLGAA